MPLLPRCRKWKLRSHIETLRKRGLKVWPLHEYHIAARDA